MLSINESLTYTVSNQVLWGHEAKLFPNLFHMLHPNISLFPTEDGIY